MGRPVSCVSVPRRGEWKSVPAKEFGISRETDYSYLRAETVTD
jgi:hypothetical protein